MANHIINKAGVFNNPGDFDVILRANLNFTAAYLGLNTDAVLVETNYIFDSDQAGDEAELDVEIAAYTDPTFYHDSSKNRLPTYDADCKFMLNETTAHLGIVYKSLADDNFANTPASNPDKWAVITGASTFNGPSVALGENARGTTPGDFGVGIGSKAGQTSQGDNSVAIGREAGQTAQGASAIAIGGFAGELNQAAQATAIGYLAGQTGQGSNSLALGYKAGQTSQGAQSVAIGREAGKTTQGTLSSAIGYRAGWLRQGDSCAAFGYDAGRDDQGAGSVAFGYESGQTNQGTNAVAVGREAGQTGQGNNSVAIGRKAGELNQGDDSIAIGYLARGTGANEIVIGVDVVGKGINTASYGNSSTLNQWFYGSILPALASKNLGSADDSWKKLYLDGKLLEVTDGNLMFDGNRVTPDPLFTTERQVADDDAWIEFDIIAGDGLHRFNFEKSTPANDVAPLLFQVYVGGAWKTSGYLSDRGWVNNNSVGGNRFTSSIRLSDGDGSATGEGSSGSLEFSQMDDTDSHKIFIGTVDQIGSNNNFAQLIGGNYKGGAVIKFRVMYLTGNIKSGVYTLRHYGAN